MRIVTIDTIHTYMPRQSYCACIGYFDGVHLGHQELIKKTVAMAKEKNCESALVTFEPDPWVTIKGVPTEALEHLTTNRQRLNLYVQYGIQNIFILRFTKAMADLPKEEFVNRILKQMNLKGLVCGFDFHFAAKGSGNAEFLQSYCSYPVEVVEQISFEGLKISSTYICELIKQGDIEKATLLLGHSFEMEGQVIAGSHKGTSIGFPTANLSISKEYVQPLPGVYACLVNIQGTIYRGMMNIGHNPTMNYSKELSYEVHLFNFNGDLYGKRISVELKHYMRKEKQFKNVDNLKMQLEQDENTAKAYLS